VGAVRRGGSLCFLCELEEFNCVLGCGRWVWDTTRRGEGVSYLLGYNKAGTRGLLEVQPSGRGGELFTRV
jgi:hypothetical protein